MCGEPATTLASASLALSRPRVDVLGNSIPTRSIGLVPRSCPSSMSAGFLAIIQFTHMGLRIQSITRDPGMRKPLGVNHQALALTLVFGFAAGRAALACALGAPIFCIPPEME